MGKGGYTRLWECPGRCSRDKSMLKAPEGQGECEGEVAGATVRPPAGPGEPCGKPGFGLGLVGIREGL